VRLTIYRADGTSAVIEAGLSAPCREPSHLVRLFADRVGSIDAGFGVDLMVLAALATEPLLPAQTAFARSEDRSKAEPLIDLLASRLEGSAVRRLAPFASHVPERSQNTITALAGSWPWPEQEPAKPPRPCLLFAEPERIDVIAEIPEGPPARFTWRRVTRRVVKAEGPERIAPEWWLALRRELPSQLLTPHPPTAKGGGPLPLPQGERGSSGLAASSNPSPLAGEGGAPDFKSGAPGEGALPSRLARTRDYYRIEDEDGRRYWVFRAGLYQEGAAELPAWYLHGVFG
jgi:protein ImuB